MPDAVHCCGSCGESGQVLLACRRQKGSEEMRELDTGIFIKSGYSVRVTVAC